MRACATCRREVEDRFRFCPRCGAAQRLKVVELFAGHPLVDRAKALRVSRSLGEDDAGRHVRFSVWSGAGGTSRAEAAVSLADDEAERLSRFLADSSCGSDQPTLVL
ncbi:MAG: hypothetical protein ACREJR_02485 [Candidatus Rokuibacteriota bacterium]